MAHGTIPLGTLAPPELAFLAEMEQVTVVPRQRLDSLPLISGSTPPLRAPQAQPLPLWLALLLKKQRRADIAPPPWLSVNTLSAILDAETAPASDEETPILTPAAMDATDARSPPFAPTSLARAETQRLPYHWLEMASLLLAGAADDVPDAEGVRRLLRDVREVRAAKIRGVVAALDAGAGVQVSGIGGLEVAETRGLVGGLVDGLRRLGRSQEEAAREEVEGGGEDDGEDVVM